MFFKPEKRNLRLDFCVWTCGDDKWTKKADARMELEEFIKIIRTLEAVRFSGVQKIEIPWSPNHITTYYCLKVSWPESLDKSIRLSTKKCKVRISLGEPFKDVVKK